MRQKTRRSTTIFVMAATLSSCLPFATAQQFAGGAAKAPAPELPAGVEPFAWPPMPKPRQLPAGPVVGGPVTHGLQLTLRPDKYQVEAMEPIFLNIDLKNTT